MSAILAIQENKFSHGWNDSLAYVDAFSDAQRAKAETLVQQECARMRSEGLSVDQNGSNLPDVSQFLVFEVRFDVANMSNSVLLLHVRAVLLWAVHVIILAHIGQSDYEGGNEEDRIWHQKHATHGHVKNSPGHTPPTFPERPRSVEAISG